LLFVISKVLWLLIEPSHVIFALVVLGIGLWKSRWSRLGYRLAAVGAASLVVFTVLPIPNLVLAPLENRFPIPQHLPPEVDGIVVLGGAVDPVETSARGIPSLNEAAERMTAFAKLARLYPSAKEVFAGGNGTIHSSDLTEADAAKRVFDDLGMDTKRIVFEHKSRNTRENALISKSLVNPRPGETWILVTSAQHMPRAVGIFRQLGWPVIPYPVGYKSDSNYDVDLVDSLKKFDGAVREWVGLVVYRGMGWTDALFPAAKT
jgi:uncharacterized SAM-binding protein YcdF (DUF218 family)